LDDMPRVDHRFRLTPRNRLFRGIGTEPSVEALFSRFNPGWLLAHEENGDLDSPAAYTDVVGAALAQVIGETCDQIPPVG